MIRWTITINRITQCVTLPDTLKDKTRDEALLYANERGYVLARVEVNRHNDEIEYLHFTMGGSA